MDYNELQIDLVLLVGAAFLGGAVSTFTDPDATTLPGVFTVSELLGIVLAVVTVWVLAVGSAEFIEWLEAGSNSRLAPVLASTHRERVSELSEEIQRLSNELDEQSHAAKANEHRQQIAEEVSELRASLHDDTDSE